MTVIIVVPVVEELVFRALGFYRLREYMVFFPAAVISGVVFGVFHGNAYQGIYAFLLGIGFAYVYECYRSILAAILMHMAANGFSVFLSELSFLCLLYTSRERVY